MRLFFLPLMLAVALLTSCQEKGCNDPEAVNYEDSVNKNDGSCRYESKVVFINTEETQAFLDAGGSVSINLEGLSYPSNDYDMTAQVAHCFTGAITISLEEKKERSLMYSVLRTDSAGVTVVFGLSGGEYIARADDCYVIDI